VVSTIGPAVLRALGIGFLVAFCDEVISHCRSERVKSFTAPGVNCVIEPPRKAIDRLFACVCSFPFQLSSVAIFGCLFISSIVGWIGLFSRV
jgi:hypothetical protein